MLGFTQHLPSEQRLYTSEQVRLVLNNRLNLTESYVLNSSIYYLILQLFDRMCVLLGGRMAEAVTFRKISTSLSLSLSL